MFNCYNQSNYLSGFKIMNPISFNPNFGRILLLSTALIVSINTIAGGRSSERNLMDDYLQDKTSANPNASAIPLQRSAFINNNALVFNRGATGVNKNDFDKKFSLAKTLTNIRNTSDATTHSSNAQLLNSLLKTLNVDSKINGFVKMNLQKRAQETALSGLVNNMLPSAIFNRFDLSASNGQHCGEYRVIYHKNNGNRFFLSFEAKYPNPEPKKGKAGCFAVADFWKEIGSMSKTNALAQLEKFFYQGLEHKGVQLPAAINFTHYTHGTGQVRSNTFVNSPWQLREFKTDIDADGKVVFVADSVKSNPLAELFADEGNLDSNSLKASRIYFARDFDGYIDNLLTPEKRATSPSSSDIINGFSLKDDNHYNEFQSDSNTTNDNTAKVTNSNLKTIINNKLAELNLSGYSAKMIMNRAEAMSCSGCHQNSSDAKIAPNVNWPKSQSFVHVNEQGALSSALTEQFLPARSAVLVDYWQKTAEKWRFAEVNFSSANNNFGGRYNAPNHPNGGAFAALKTDGSITAWGASQYGGTSAPFGSGYTMIYSTEYAFAALKTDGSITAWGRSGYGGSGAPSGSGYTKIYSTSRAFAALKADGSIKAWGDSDYGGSGAPSGSGYTKIYSNETAFAALQADGSITAWGRPYQGSAGAPSNGVYTKIYSTERAFAALEANGSIKVWGKAGWGGTGAPDDSGYIKIYSNSAAFAAIKADGSIKVWGDSDYGGSGAPYDKDYTEIYSNSFAFVALKADGSITAWGKAGWGGTGAPDDSGYIKIYSTHKGFAAIKADGSIKAWGVSGTGAPSDIGYTKIASNFFAFAALKADGSIKAWGDSSSGGTGAPSGNGYTKIYSTSSAFVALKADGSITAWGHSNLGGTTPASIDWIVPTKVVSYPMNGDISVDIEPIHRTTGHKSAAFVGGYNTIDAPTRMTWSLNAGLSKFSVVLHDMDKGTEYKVHLVAKMISKLGCNFIAINNAATCLGDVHNKLFISFDKVLNNSLPSGITLSGRFSLKRLQWPNMNTTNIEMHNFEINWKVPSHSKVVNHTMNGDISVDIEPIHRTTGHKSAAFVGGFNTIGAPTRMTWSLNAGLSKFSVMLRNMDNGTEYKVHLVAKMISKLGCNFIAINNAATCYGDVHNKLFISFDKALNKNLPSGITLSGNFALTRLQWPDMNTSNIEIHNFKINWKVPSH